MARVKHPPYRVDRREHANVAGSIVNPAGVVVHATESHDRDGASDLIGVAMYLENTKNKPGMGVGLGVHRIIDEEGMIARTAKVHAPGNMVYHAPGANSTHLGIELIGFARFDLAKWLSRRKQLRALAWELAYLSQRLDFPLRYNKHWGVSLHRDFPLGGHSCPGPRFPLRRVLRMARWNVRRAAQGKTYGWNTPLNPVLHAVRR